MEKSSANSKHSNGEKNNAKKEWKEREMERAISIQMGDRFVSSNKTMYKCCRNKAVYKLKNWKTSRRAWKQNKNDKKMVEALHRHSQWMRGMKNKKNNTENKH